MAKFHAWKLCSLIVVIVAILPLVTMQRGKIDAKIDIVVVLQFDDENEENWPAVAYKELGTYFEFGPEKARFAIVFYLRKLVHSEDASMDRTFNWLVLNMTSDWALYDRTLANFSMPTPDNIVPWPEQQNPTEILTMVRKHVFPDVQSRDRAKALVYIVQHDPGSVEEFGRKAAKLRKLGVRIYMIVQNSTRHGNEDMIRLATNATNRKRVIVWPGDQYTEDLVDRMIDVKNAILRDLCRWDKACVYKNKERTRCSFDAWIRYTSVNDPKQCDAVKPKRTKCIKRFCVKECDKRWPWEDRTKKCGTKCGTTVGRRRGKEAPPKMENCSRWLRTCPQCPSPAPESDGAFMGVVVYWAVLILIGLAVVYMIISEKKAPKCLSDKRAPKTVSKKFSKKRASAKAASQKATDATSKGLSSKSTRKTPTKTTGDGKEALVGRSLTLEAHAAVAADLPVVESERKGRKPVSKSVGRK